jgi:hypothetical protein
MVLETVKIECGDSYAIINKEDFDPKVHKEFKEKKAAKRKKAAKAD